MEIVNKLRQCCIDINNIHKALEANLNRATELVVEVLREKGSIDVEPGKNVHVTFSGERHLDPFKPKEMIEVRKIAISGAKDDVVVSGILEETPEDGNRDISVSIYDIDDPENILNFLISRLS